MKNLFFSLFIISTGFSQEFSVKFKFFKSHPHESRHMTKNFTLLQNDNYSSFELDNINDVTQFKFHENVSVCNDGDTLKTYLINNGKTIVQLYKEKVFKDFKLNRLIYNPFAAKSCQIVEDKIDVFNWELIENNDTIIANYKCKKAITKFRGRNYVAYYTNEIANQGGPWKFDGLPGFILKVYSKDGFMAIYPSEIILKNKEKINITNPFFNKKTILFEDWPRKIVQLERKDFIKAKSGENPPVMLTHGSLKEIEIEDIGLNKERIYE